MEGKNLRSWDKPKKKLADGFYSAVLLSVEDKDGKSLDKAGNLKKLKRFTFSVADLKNAEKFEMGWTCLDYVTADSKCGKTVRALGIKENEAFDYAGLVGKLCRVCVEVVEIGEEGDKHKCSVITKVKPVEVTQ